ncbi:MAG: hypothetical protein JWN14_4900 [Chthonomonadales bacterium]|nr:hypothetical protein [Chthonomonadales bacterium]
MRCKLSVLLALLSVTPSWAVQGTLQGDYSCPTRTCKTICDGPGGHREITGYGRLFSWVVSSPPHVILELDTGHQIMVGAADACDFDGASTPISGPPIGPSRLDDPNNPIHPPVVCTTIPGHPQQCH